MTLRPAHTLRLTIDNRCGALIDICASYASCLCINVVVDDMQLQAAFDDCDAIVDRHKVTLCDLQTCTHAQTDNR